MPASIRIIKIVKDKNPVGEETEAFTAEIEVECDDVKQLMLELETTPVGKDIAGMIKRAEFIPETTDETPEEVKAKMEKEEEERLINEERLREEGRYEIREKYLTYIRKKRPNQPIEEVKEEAEDDGNGYAMMPAGPVGFQQGSGVL